MKQIIINHEQLQKRVALIEDSKIQEYYIETGENERIVGSIFRGRVTNLEPSLQAAFVDIGLDKNAFLHYWDMIPATKDALEREDDGRSKSASDYEDEIEAPEEEEKPPEEKSVPPEKESFVSKIFNLVFPKPKKEEPKKPRVSPRRRPKKVTKEVNIEDIPKTFSVNSNVIVQVTKGSIGTKGPRVTTNLSIPGRYVVLLPNSSHLGVSRRIEDRKERQRLREIIRNLDLPKNMGLICRTASIGLSENALKIDVGILVEKWKNGQELLRENKTPICIYKEPDLLESTIRDYLSDDIDEIIVDSKQAYDLTLSYVKKLDKKDFTRVKFYDNPKPIFQSHNLLDQIRQIYQRTVTLASGAELCIDETEALIAIDVNSKKSRKGKDHPETILNTNLDAAEEIGRQLRLRNIGGLVIADFIDMRSKKDRIAVYRRLKEVLSKDRAKTKMLPISKLGLLEMTRQREYESLQNATYITCNYCKGTGLIKSSLTISIEIQRRLQELLRRNRGTTKIRVTVHPEVLSRLKNEDANILEEMEREFGGDLTFRADPKLHKEEYRLSNLDKNKKNGMEGER